VDVVKINDIFAGILLLALAIALAAGAWGLPNPAGQPFGPAAFPHLLALLLGLSSVILLVTGIRDESRGPLMALAGWTRRRPQVVRFLLVPAAVIFYILFADELGFLVAAVIILSALFLAGNIPATQSLALAVGAALLVHTVFYLGLSVQLPWGLLDSVRW
jgi:putative tricarboxylic transport membrane protein